MADYRADQLRNASLVVWDWDSGATDQTSVFEAADGGTVTTIDANCPDRVARRTRSASLVTAYLLVNG